MYLINKINFKISKICAVQLFQYRNLLYNINLTFNGGNSACGGSEVRKMFYSNKNGIEKLIELQSKSDSAKKMSESGLQWKEKWRNSLVGKNKKFDQDKLIPSHIRDVVTEKITPSYIKRYGKVLNNLTEQKMKKGFRGYEMCLTIVGINVNTIGGMRSILIKEIGYMLKNLEKMKVYSLLINVYDDNKEKNSSLLPYSLFIYEGTDVLQLSNILIKYLVLFNQKYQFDGELTLKFFIREWYIKKNIELTVNNSISNPEKENIYDSLINSVNTDLKKKNSEIEDRFNLNKNKFIYNKIKFLRKRCIAFRLNPYIINNLSIITVDFNYTLYSLDNFTHYFIEKSDITNNNISYEFTLLEINNKYDNPTQKNYFIIQSKKINNDFGLTSLSSDIIYTWTDYIDFKNMIITRYYLENKIDFDLSAILLIKRKNFIKNIELVFNFPNYLEMNKDYILDDKIGVIDFETLKINDEGEQCVYSGGWAVKDFLYYDYLDNINNKFATQSTYTQSTQSSQSTQSTQSTQRKEITASPSEAMPAKLEQLSASESFNTSTVSDSISNSFKLSSYKLIKKLFDSIFESKFSNYTFYMHNLGGFDYIFILSALSFYNKEYDLNAIIKDDGNILVSLKISKYIEKITNKKIYNEDMEVVKVEKIKSVERKSINILDSNLILPGKLRNLAKDFNCKELKGYFPYKFININNLNYIGELPSYEYFSDSMEFNDYMNWKKSFQDKYSYDIKKESIRYLKNDLIVLLEIMTKFSELNFNKFAVNITKNKTISGLSLKIYMSEFYKYDYNFKIIKGDVEREIRQAYFGGLVLTKEFYKHNSKAYVYDVNSHYPSAMLEDMPVGNPILSTSTDLNSYFGFVYAEIIPPKDLKAYFIPLRDINGNITTPNYKFNGLYFSELLKESINYGYKINVIWGYKFERGKDVFKEYIETLYNERLQAKKDGLNSIQYIYKLLLNSSYGRFGMREIENKLKILSKDEATKFMTKKNITYYSELHDKVVLRYNNNVNRDIMKFSEIKENSNTFVNDIKQRGVTSSIPIAAAITSWALIKLLKFLNICNNNLIYSDTDSVTLEKPLPDKYLSKTELGKMKLEFILSEGIYISPKFYGLKGENGETIIKSKGIAKGKVNYQDLDKLYKGEDLTVKTTVFRKNLAKGTVNIIDMDYTIKGNHPD